MTAFALCSCDFLDTLLGIPAPKSYVINGESKLVVHFIDVGQGDSILLESKEEFVLVDGGESIAGEKVADYIEERGCDELKYVIATHPDSDHIGGLKTVLDTIDTENFITSETDKSTRTWLNVLHAVEDNKINYIDAQPGSTYSFGEASFTVLAPLSDDYTDYNNYSVVIKAVCGDISFLLTGDAEKESENEMLRSGENLRADVLKCGHHGSSTSTSDRFLSAVSPAFAVISCGKNNDYGHPHFETIAKLEKAGVTYFRTDQLGTVIASTDGEGISFFTTGGKELDSATFSRSDETLSSDTKEIVYVGNKNSHVFHLPDCGGVKTMNENNKVYFNSREDAVNNGYTPCGQCNP